MSNDASILLLKNKQMTVNNNFANDLDEDKTVNHWNERETWRGLSRTSLLLTAFSLRNGRSFAAAKAYRRMNFVHRNDFVIATLQLKLQFKPAASLLTTVIDRVHPILSSLYMHFNTPVTISNWKLSTDNFW